MSKKSASTRGGVGFAGLLTIAFVVLKLMNVIDWSWWWVVSPLWSGVALLVIAILIMLIIVVVMTVIQDVQKRRRERARENT